MSVTFWISYGVLWLLVVVESLLIFALLRELGRIYLRQPQSIARDGLEVATLLPELPLETQSGPTVLQRLLDAQHTIVVCVLPDCPLCMPVIETVQRILDRSEGLGAVVLVSASTFGKYAALQGMEVALAAPRDILRELRVRATPFIFVVDSQGEVLSKGLVNTRRDVRRLLELADITLNPRREVAMAQQGQSLHAHLD